MKLNAYQLVSESLEYYSTKDFDPNNYELFISRLMVAASNQNYKVHNLGETNHLPLTLLVPKQLIKAPSVLIASGFHGNEPAPCWAVLRILEKNKELLSKCNVSFLPCVNPYGFKNNQRVNMFNEDPNRGFYYGSPIKLPKKETILSAEGKQLLTHIDLLKQLSSSAFYTLHEDKQRDKFYMYSNQDTELEHSMINAASKYIDILDKGIVDKGNKKAHIVNGLTSDMSIGSFEDYLIHKGIPISICTETLSKEDLVKRVHTNMSLIYSFLNYFSKHSM